jgi:hypothetical protein
VRNRQKRTRRLTSGHRLHILINPNSKQISHDTPPDKSWETKKRPAGRSKIKSPARIMQCIEQNLTKFEKVR